MTTSLPSDFAYEFNFVGDFSDDVYQKCPSKSDNLLAAVTAVCVQLKYVLGLPASVGLANISMPVECDAATYKVRLARA
jgi:hypothetical protein